MEVNSGRTVYIAGQVSLDSSGNVVGKGDFAAQTNQTRTCQCGRGPSDHCCLTWV
ncbi:MAG TPA: hypothetical protein VKK06_14425 [Terriglobia bacterium]|nr:hypothetical protein [Terriglobia bacterium]